MKKKPTATRNKLVFHWLTTSARGWECNNDLETCLRKQRMADTAHNRQRPNAQCTSFALFSVPGDSEQSYWVDPQMGPINQDGSQLAGVRYIATIHTQEIIK